MSRICRIVDGIGGSTLLDLNDESGYFLLDGSEFPLPEVLYTEVENSLCNGKRLSSWRLGGRNITLKLYLKGTSIADLQDKRDTLFKWLMKSNTLEYRNWGEGESVFYTTWPITPKVPDYAKKYIKDVYAETDIILNITVEPEVRKGLETLTVFENLAPNGDCENWTGAELDDWTRTEAAGSTVVKETTVVWHGANALELARVTGNCYVTTTDFITVDATHHWQFDVFGIDSAGDPNLKLLVLCYDTGGNLLGTLTIANSAPAATWFQHACKNEVARGVIEPADWSVGTTKVKLKIENSADNSTAHVDQIIFGDTEFIPNHRMEAAVSLVVPPAEIKGVLPADLNVYLDKDIWQPSAVFLGQRKNYHASFNGVREPTEVSSQDLNCCLGQNYEEYTPAANLILNPGFEAPGGFAEDNTDAFTNWTITRDSTPGASYIGATNNPDSVYAGTWALAVYDAGAGSVQGSVISDKFAVDITKDHYWELLAKQTSSYANFLYIFARFYDAGNALVGSKSLIIARPDTDWRQYNGYIYVADFPATATQMAIDIHDISYNAGAGDMLSVDSVWVSECGQALGETDFNIESHEGNYLDLALVSVDSETDEDNIIDLQAQVVSDASGPITEVFSRSSVDIGNPNTEWVCTGLVNTATWDKSFTPVSNVHSLADKSLLSERARILLPQEFDVDAKFWLDFIARIPVDLAIMRLTNLIDEEHIILGGEGAFVSLDGTVNTATTIDSSKVNPPFASFKADPDGINMVLVCLYDNDGSYEPRPIMNITFKYYPCYLL